MSFKLQLSIWTNCVFVLFLCLTRLAVTQYTLNVVCFFVCLFEYFLNETVQMTLEQFDSPTYLKCSSEHTPSNRNHKTISRHLVFYVDSPEVEFIFYACKNKLCFEVLPIVCERFVYFPKKFSLAARLAVLD